MTMLKKLKSLFVVEDENAADPSAKTSTSEKVEKSVITTKAINPKEMNISADEKPAEKFVDVLLKAIENGNQEGFDYLEFKQSIQSLEGVNMDAMTRYKSALAMAKTMGASSDKLLKSGEHYLNILKTENKKFAEALRNQETKQISGRKDAVKKIEQTIQEKKKQIARLQKELEENDKELETARKSVEGASEKMEKTKRGFAVAYLSVTSQIEEDIQNIKQYSS